MGRSVVLSSAVDLQRWRSRSAALVEKRSSKSTLAEAMVVIGMPSPGAAGTLVGSLLACARGGRAAAASPCLLQKAAAAAAAAGAAAAAAAPGHETLCCCRPYPPGRATPRVYASSNRSLGSTLGRGNNFRDGEMLVLGIETSCDDTGAAVVSADGGILGEAIASQADLLAQWGGVVPKLAQDEHIKFIDKVVADALQNAGVQESDLSAIAVTIGPGLGLCLRVGVRKARKIARTHQLPVVAVHHMEAHALVVRLMEKAVQFPFVVLLISGGHNLILLAQNVGEYVQLGTTMDDAIGEAYDKTARLLGLDLRNGGGPALEEIAREGNPKAVKFSVPLKGVRYRDCNFSYAGLKNQVRLAIDAQNIDGDRIPLSTASVEDRQVRANIAASFQGVAIQHLEDKLCRGIEWARRLAPSISTLVVSGGVASNQEVRGRLYALAEEMGLHLVCPPPRLCTDNGVMVAWAGIEHLRLGMYEDPPSVNEPDDIHLDLRPRWQLGEIYAEGLSEARSMKSSGNHPSLTAQVKSILRAES